MRTLLQICVLTLFVPLAQACSASGGSCTFSGGICYDLLDVDSPSGFCASGGGTYTDAACPTARRVGRCTVDGVDDRGGYVAYRINYYEPRTTEEVRTGCSGTFEAN